MIEDVEDTEVDEASDRTDRKLYVGRKVRGIYTNGLFVGTILYYNFKLNKYCIAFEDESRDYVSVSDFLTDNNLELLPIE